MPLAPEIEAFLNQAAAAGGPSIADLPPEGGREMYRAMQPLAPEIEVGRVEDRTIDGPGGAIPLRIYTPAGDGPFPVLMNFHGGGWVIGDLDTADAQCRMMCAGADCMVVSVDYRLAPEHRFPAAVDDCYAATCWVAEHAASLGGDPNKLAVGGDSAGGNLAAVVALLARDQDGPALCLQLLIYPVTDADFGTGSYADNAAGYLLERATMEWFWDHYLPDANERRDPRAAPLRATDLAGLPPALVQTAEFDPLRDEGEAYGHALEAAGNEVTITRYDGLIHGYLPMARNVEAAVPAMREACDALRKAFSN